MRILTMIGNRRPVWQGEGQGAGAGAADAAGAAAAALAGAGAGAEAGAGAADPGAGAAAAKPWYEERTWSDPTLQQHLIKSGYHNGTSDEALERALKGELTATTKLGRNPATLLDAPKEGQTVNEWMKANAKAFGVPDSLDKYELKLPEGLPEGMPIDTALLADFRKYAHEAGLPPAVAQANIEAYAAMMTPRFTQEAARAAEAEAKMTGDLQTTWGQNYKTNQDLAVRAFQTLAAEMKMDPEQSKMLAGKLNKEMGDAGLLKFFHTLAGKMGEDTLAIPRGGNAPALALADAQQRKAAIMTAHTGDMAKATREGNTRRVTELRKEMEGLNVILAQHG
ncbi:MAG: hypothetical protein V4712_15245 [Pseudomonadota bacterium]